ncbi:MAG: rod shape-determining protein RodA [Deltaproteobacteria bacterium]
MFKGGLIKNFDWTLLAFVLGITAMGLVNLYSASYQSELAAFKKQSVWVVAGLIAMGIVCFMDYRTIERYAIHIYIVSILFLIAVLGFGREVAGSKSWLSLGQFISIQPSEFVKIPIILVIAKFYHRDFGRRTYGFSDLIKPIALVLLPLGLVMLQPDLGTGLIIILISGSLVFFMGLRWKTVLFLLVLIIGVCFISWHSFLKEYQKDRIKTFIDPTHDPLGSGYNSIQSQIAVGSGEFLGKGFTKGSQSQLRFIPAQQTDFAFSVFAEEWGFAGAFSALALYYLLILWIFDTAGRAKDRFAMLASFGVAAMFFWHILINVGMVVGLLPVTGVPLFLFSYGGSSTVIALVGVGLILGIRMRRPALAG